jgi:AcrR family transcriptional regulator
LLFPDAATTRERLVQAAYEVYLEAGWQGASLAGIADRVGLTTGAVYTHFKGKNELFVAVCDAQFRQMAVEIGERMRGAATTSERLDILRDWFARRSERAGVRLIYDLWHQASEYPRVRKALHEVYERMTADVERELEQHLGPGLLALGLPPRTLAIIGTALMEGLLLRQFLAQSDDSLDAVFAFVRRMLGVPTT